MPSIQHEFIAKAIPRVRRPSVRRSFKVVDPDVVRRAKLTEHARADTTPPTRTLRDFDIHLLPGFGFPVYDLTVSGTDPQRSIVYLHGGGYVSHADPVHWKYVARLAKLLNARIVFPVYPLAPEFTWRDSHPQMLELFEQVAVESAHGVTMMGDSAGGGYALAVAEQLSQSLGPQPTHVVLISPWVDLTSSTPGTAEASARDPGLKMSRLRLSASWWSGQDETTRPEVSPLNGALTGLPPTLMFCGTLDTLHPQCRVLASRATTAGWDLTYVEQAHLCHVYPLLPIPESKPALAQVLEFLDQAPVDTR